MNKEECLNLGSEIHNDIKTEILKCQKANIIVINEIEFEREGEIEIKFVPIRPGEYDFEIERLQSKGMVGKFIVK